MNMNYDYNIFIKAFIRHAMRHQSSFVLRQTYTSNRKMSQHVTTSFNPIHTMASPSTGLMTQANAMRIPFLFYRIFFVSPIGQTAHGGLGVSKKLAFYYAIVAVIYSALIICTWPPHSSWADKVIAHYGYIWYAITLVDVSLSRLSFLAIGFISVQKCNYQIVFFRTLVSIDDRLRQRFGRTLNDKRLLLGYLVMMMSVVGIVVFSGYVQWKVLTAMVAVGMDLPVTVLLCTFVLERINLWLLTCAFVGCSLMVSRRLRVLLEILKCDRRQSADESSDAEETDSNVPFIPAVEIYGDLYRLIELMSAYMGSITLMRAGHDFIATTSTGYYMCLLHMQSGPFVAAARTRAIYLFVQNAVRPLMVCVAAQWALDAIDECGRVLNRFAVRTAVDREAMESFQYWSLHHGKAHFSAAKFFDINMAFFYAVCVGAVFCEIVSALTKLISYR